MGISTTKMLAVAGPNCYREVLCKCSLSFLPALWLSSDSDPGLLFPTGTMSVAAALMSPWGDHVIAPSEGLGSEPNQQPVHCAPSMGCWEPSLGGALPRAVCEAACKPLWLSSTGRNKWTLSSSAHTRTSIFLRRLK